MEVSSFVSPLSPCTHFPLQRRSPRSSNNSSHNIMDALYYLFPEYTCVMHPSSIASVREPQSGIDQELVVYFHHANERCDTNVK